MRNKEFKDISSLAELTHRRDNQNMHKRAFNSLRRSCIFLDKCHQLKPIDKLTTLYSPKVSEKLHQKYAHKGLVPSMPVLEQNNKKK